MIIRHPCLARSALLKAYKSRKPITPSSFDLQSLDHFQQWIFRSPSLLPLQNLAMMDWRSSHNVLGSLKTLIAWVAVAWAMAFIKISLPPKENSFPRHICNFFQSHSLIPLKTLL